MMKSRAAYNSALAQLPLSAVFRLSFTLLLLYLSDNLWFRIRQLSKCAKRQDVKKLNFSLESIKIDFVKLDWK
jgi:hypothetical protein